MTRAEGEVKSLLHATCVDISGKGVLILGTPGAGKSDLALRLIDQPGHGAAGTLAAAVLVADDQVRLTKENGRLLARPPARLAGLLEIRGLGILKVPFREQTFIALAVSLTSGPVERLPEPTDLIKEFLGIQIPLLPLDAHHASAPARVRAALKFASLSEAAMISTASH